MVGGIGGGGAGGAAGQYFNDLVLQVAGKLRGSIRVPANADRAAIESAETLRLIRAI
jgi:hypothetical protein